MKGRIAVASIFVALVFAGAAAFTCSKWCPLVGRFGTGVAYFTVYRVDSGPLKGEITVADFPTPPPNVNVYFDVPLGRLSLGSALISLAMLGVGVYLFKDTPFGKAEEV